MLVCAPYRRATPLTAAPVRSSSRTICTFSPTDHFRRPRFPAAPIRRSPSAALILAICATPYVLATTGSSSSSREAPIHGPRPHGYIESVGSKAVRREAAETPTAPTNGNRQPPNVCLFTHGIERERPCVSKQRTSTSPYFDAAKADIEAHPRRRLPIKTPNAAGWKIKTSRRVSGR